MTIEMYSDDEFKRLLRFDKVDVQRLIHQLRLPDFFISSERHRFEKVFSFLLFLRRMAYPGKLADLEIEFARDHTSLSRSLTATLSWLDENHSGKITDNLPFFMPYQTIYADAVAAKTDVPERFRHVNSFIDGVAMKT